MKNDWSKIVILSVSNAIYVARGMGKATHKERPYHGLILNDKDAARDYYFSDGRVMHTDRNELFYLPMGSSYSVRSVEPGACYAINFHADIDDEPFCVRIKNIDSLKKSFKIACDEWRLNLSSGVAAMRALYEGIYLLQNEGHQDYMPNERHRLIIPAIEAIDARFADPNLTVAELAAMCGMSEVYLRKIFIHSLGASPKEYIIRKRIDYARQLLSLGELEVLEVAGMCGYTEPCHFSREFTKRVGVSPSQYFGK